MPLRLEIATPEGQAFSEEVDQVVLPGVEGEFGVLPGHEPLITQIHPGELVITQRSKTHYMAIGDGFAEVGPDRVFVISHMAIRADDINEMEAETERKRAEEALSKKLSDEEAATVTSTLMHALAQLHVKRRHRP